MPRHVKDSEMEARLDFALVFKHGTQKGLCKKRRYILAQVRAVLVTLTTLSLILRTTLHSAVPPAKLLALRF